MDDDSAADVMYSEQLTHFLACIAGQASPAQGIEAAAQTLNIALCAAHASQSRREVTIASHRVHVEPVSQKKTANGSISRSKVLTIVQARMKSARLPGKVLADVAGKPMLGRVVERANSALLSNGLVVATTEDPLDEMVEQYCGTLGVPCFRGSQSDVLKRYAECARRFAADAIVRITADCPLIDPSLIDEVIRTFFEASADYASNRRFGSPRPEHSFPDGLDVEVFTSASLEAADLEARAEYDREHVTPFIWRQFGRFRLLHIQSPKEFRRRSWTVDYPEDLDFVRQIFEHLGGRMFGYKQVLALLEDNPEIAKSNGHVVPNGDWRYAGRDMMLHDRTALR
jgi:spore coat polysaccharide biosynthesis protein SpsF (cytidylyltransferase family)